MPAMRAAPRIGLVAGEKSGDLLGAGLITALRERFPEAEFSGLGGDAMLGEGLVTIGDMERLSVMGLIEPLKRLPDLLRLRRDLFQHFLQWRADIVIGIDSPDFNLGLEKRLRQQGITTVHYVCPSVWAWRQGRVKKIRAAVDHVLALLPFEQAFLEKHGVAASFVGHPLADRLAEEQSCPAADHQENLTLALLPGSRSSEVRQLLEVFLQAARLCQNDLENLQLVIAAANQSLVELIREELEQRSLQEYFQIRLCRAQDESLQCMREADVILLASGTATLEAALLGRPMVVAYKMSAAGFAIARQLVKIDHVALPNLLLEQRVVPELIQDEATPQRLAQELLALLQNPERRRTIQQQLGGLRAMLAKDASRTAASVVADLLEQPNSVR